MKGSVKMASTNKTTNYELSQYVGTDKPTYLSDYNGDMYKIDEQMKTNADNIATAISSAQTATTTANQANTTAGQANTTAQTANQTAQSASSTATNAQSTANSALATATTAQASATQTASDLNDFMLKFNLNNNYKFITSDVSTNGLTINTLDMYIAKNNDSSLFKFYGLLVVNSSGAGSKSIVFNNTGLTVNEAYSIRCVSIASDATHYDRNMNASVENNKITLTGYFDGGGQYFIITPPCLYFNANFGDDSGE